MGERIGWEGPMSGKETCTVINVSLSVEEKK